LLFHALKSFTPHIHEKWTMSELDRLKRMKQIERLTSLLESSESDREARLVQIDELTGLVETCETDRADRLGLLEALRDKLNHEIQRALVAEQGWQALESTHVVRKARRLGLVKLEKPGFLKTMV